MGSYVSAYASKSWGLPPEVCVLIGGAVGAGLGKININTELRAAVLDAAARQLPDSRAAGDDVLSLERTWRSAASAFAREAMLRLDSAA